MDSIITIAGPTAIGKTDLSLSLAKRLGGEIISADSMQVYKYMDIGTAKPSKDELNLIPHHMIDEINPDENFSVAHYQKMAREYIQDVLSREKVPILVGGTGFYINAVLSDIQFSEENESRDNSEYRKWLYDEAKKHGNEYLHSKLKDIDIVSYEKIHSNNVIRVIRALEYYKETGERISDLNARQKNSGLFYRSATFILDMDRGVLYDRINKRVDKMFESGLLKEVRLLLEMGYSRDMVSMQGLGYKETIRHIYGELSLEETIDTIKQATRNYAKRQITWFKHQLQGDLITAVLPKNEIISRICESRA